MKKNIYKKVGKKCQKKMWLFYSKCSKSQINVTMLLQVWFFFYLKSVFTKQRYKKGCIQFFRERVYDTEEEEGLSNLSIHSSGIMGIN
jgi:hypothetical protein